MIGKVTAVGVIHGEDSSDYTFTNSVCLRNMTHFGKLLHQVVYFGSVQPGKAAWVSWKPVDAESAQAMETSSRLMGEP